MAKNSTLVNVPENALSASTRVYTLVDQLNEAIGAAIAVGLTVDLDIMDVQAVGSEPQPVITPTVRLVIPKSRAQ